MQVIMRAINNSKKLLIATYSSSSNISSHSQSLGKLNHLGFDLPDVWARRRPTATTSTYCFKPHFDGPSAEIIDGKSIAAIIKSQVAGEISRMKHTLGKHPSLAIVLIGERNDSHSFVRTKMKACDEVGITMSTIELCAECTEDEALHVVSNLNNNPSIHGVIVQLPLPKDANRKHGFHITGDVCFEEAIRVASAVTPVPGGVGPVTSSMLLSNTLDSAKRAYNFVP